MSWGHKKFIYMTADTYTAQSGTIEQAVKLDALIAKRGPIITAKAEGTLKILAPHGQQVVKGKDIFQIVNDSIQIRYDDDLLRVNSSIKKLQDEWSLLAASYDSKTAAFNKQAKDLLKKQSAAGGILSPDDEDALRFAMQQGQASAKQRQDKKQEYIKKINTYATKKAAMEKEYTQNIMLAKAAVPGLLSYSVGQNPVPWSDTAAVALQSTSFAAMKEQQTLLEDASLLTKGQKVAQIVDTSAIRLISIVSDESMQGLTLKGDYPIVFDDYGNSRTMGKLIAIGNSKNAKKAIVFECKKWIKDFVGVSQTRVTVIKKSFSGIVIPEKSVYKRDGKIGVFVKKGGNYSFVPIKIRGEIGIDVAVEGISSQTEISTEPESLSKYVK